MKKVRWLASCAVFGGNIEVSGGYNDIEMGLNTVESYDVVADA